jgi:hypothetical protein
MVNAKRSQALSGARFPGQYNFKVYNEEQVRPPFYEAAMTPDLALAYFVVQVLTSGCVPRWLDWLFALLEMRYKAAISGSFVVLKNPGVYRWREFSLSSARFNSSSFSPASPSLPSAVRR